NIKIRSESGVLAIFENIHPPTILAASCHMIRHNIQQQAHVALHQFPLQQLEFFFGTDFRIYARGVRNVVAVTTTLATDQDWRRLQIGDAKVTQIVEKPRGVREAEVLVELQPVGRKGSFKALHGGTRLRESSAHPARRASR